MKRGRIYFTLFGWILDGSGEALILFFLFFFFFFFDLTARAVMDHIC